MDRVAIKAAFGVPNASALIIRSLNNVTYKKNTCSCFLKTNYQAYFHQSHLNNNKYIISSMMVVTI